MGNEAMEFEKEYQEEMDKLSLPLEMSGNYRIKKCLKCGKDSWTSLVEEKVTGMLCVVKCAEGTRAVLLEREASILKKLSEKCCKGIPRFYTLLEEDEYVFLVREYISGKTLYEIVQENGAFSGRQTMELDSQLCALLSQLHNLDEPLIHRDIKPENIVLSDGGELVLVDFDTVRTYRKDGAQDTFVMGSKETAAPEQYGYSQTDLRTDVYAIGRTLWYLAAGGYGEEELKLAPISRKLKSIILKASSFDPSGRYESTMKLDRALRRCEADVKYWKASGIAAAMLIIAASVISWMVFGTDTVSDQGTHTDAVFLSEDNKIPEENNISEENDISEKNNVSAENDAATKNMNQQDYVDAKEQGQERQTEPVVFKEPLIEAAVRQELGLTGEEEISKEMLDEVYEIRIVGNDILTSQNTIANANGWINNYSSGASGETGSIGDISDLGMLKNLRVLFLGNEMIQDISPLQNMQLRQLYLAGNRISDFSAVSSMPYLEELFIGGNPVKNLDILKNCTNLRSLNIDGMDPDSLKFLEGLDFTQFSCRFMDISSKDCESLLSQENMNYLVLGEVEDKIVKVVSQMKSVENLFADWKHSVKNLTPSAGMDNLKLLDVSDGLYSLKGIEVFPNLETLSIVQSGVEDLSPILDALKLNYININGLRIQDMSPLLEHTSLSLVECSMEQEKEILKLNSNPNFQILV